MHFYVVDGDPLRHVMSSWSRHLNNFATWESIYSVFPVSSIDRGYISRVSFTYCEQSHIEKYVERGFTESPLEDLSTLVEFQSDRFLVDGSTRRIPFSGAPMEPDEMLRAWRLNVFLFKLCEPNHYGVGFDDFDDS